VTNGAVSPESATVKGPGLVLDGIARRFGRRWVLRGIDLVVEPGTVLAITGRNGSGKTTLLRICATLLRPTRGTATVFGQDVVQQADTLRGRLGYLAHDAGLYANLTAEENLLFAQRMTGMPADHGQVERILMDVGLSADRAEKVRGFSSGMRRRLALGRILLRPPRLLLLDEPYASFDTDGIDLVNAFATRTAAGGGIVIVATHDLLRARSVLHREVRIHEGRLVERGDPADDVLVVGAPGENGG
jgi:heme ABC exporter ATP-binding subunit CcmA